MNEDKGGECVCSQMMISFDAFFPLPPCTRYISTSMLYTYTHNTDSNLLSAG